LENISSKEALDDSPAGDKPDGLKRHFAVLALEGGARAAAAMTVLRRHLAVLCFGVPILQPRL
jgi:hypothetical protein